MTFTPEQEQAITIHDRCLIVTAGAGSGKTRVLVERFLALLESHSDWSLPSLVAITFTEKAAREMRDRVRQAIEIRLAQAVSSNDREAVDRWLEHQASLSSTRIGTIHALCAGLLRANPAESGLDPDFEVWDENEAAMQRDDALDLALAQMVASGHPASTLLVEYGVSNVYHVLQAYSSRSAADAVLTALDQTPDDLKRRWRSDWERSTREALVALQSDADLRAALDWIHPADLPPGDKLADVWRQVHAATPALLGHDPAACLEAAAALANGIKVNVGSKTAWGGEEELKATKEALKYIRSCLKELLEALPPDPAADADTAERLFHWRDVIRWAADVYARFKRERTALDFDDLETLARRLLLDFPQVAARYHRAFNAVLVDEFQDTNSAQRDIIYRLAGIGEPGLTGRLFVVGDPKQSIYAFRGADVCVFGAVRDDLLAHGGEDLPLSTSFRTHDRLVRACNDLFASILRTGSGPAARYEIPPGEPMAAYRPSSPDQISLHACPLTVIAIPPADGQSADDIRRREAWALAETIHRLVESRAPVWDRDLDQTILPDDAWVPDFALAAGRGAYRPLDYGDVALLFQSMTHAPVYEDVFKAAGLPYVTIAGKGYFDRPEVEDLLILLTALHNPADDLALAVVLRSPLFGLSDETLYALRLLRTPEGRPLPLWDALQANDAPFLPPSETAACQFAAATLAELHALAGRATIAELLARALSQTGYLAVLTGLPDGDRRRGNVEKLTALARQSGRISLGDFNAYARQLTAREVREGEAAVETTRAALLMSVHASKGLEFPVVVLADSSWQRSARPGVFCLDPDAGAACVRPSQPGEKPPEPFVWAWAKTLAGRRDLAERRRLLYVGATRAADHLIVSGALKQARPSTWLRQWLDALGLSDDDLAPSPEPWVYDYPWGSCAVVVPPEPPDPDRLIHRQESGVTGWDHPAVMAGEPLAGVQPALPPLVTEVPAEPDAPARDLTATQIAKLGRAPFYDPTGRGLAAFRHSVYHDMPEPLRPLPPRDITARDLRRLIGNIVHRALRAWLLPAHTDSALLLDRLRTYAWEQGLTQPEQHDLAVDEALALLRRFEASDIAARLARAAEYAPVYRELPFVYSTGKRSIHGVIDVLFREYDRWHVLDYKTALVSAGRAADNARGYFLQVGVYAAAVQAKTGQMPLTSLYYIHPAWLVRVLPEDWQPALARLDDDVSAALGLEFSG